MMGVGDVWLGMFLMLVFWLAIVGLAIWLSSRLFPTDRGAAHHNQDTRNIESSKTELDRLNERYAEGKISRAEDEEVRQGFKTRRSDIP